MSQVDKMYIRLTDMIVYTYAEFGRNCLKNKYNITHCSVLHWEFALV